MRTIPQHNVRQGPARAYADAIEEPVPESAQGDYDQEDVRNNKRRA